MEDEEILKILKRNSDYSWKLDVTASIHAIVTILVREGMVTREEFDKILEDSIKKTQKDFLALITDKEKEDLKSIKNSKSFGGKII